jgi:hypothetical protein
MQSKPRWGTVTASVKMIRFSYSNEDIKDEEEEVGLMAERAHGRGAAPRAKPMTTLKTRCSTQLQANWP